MEKTCEQTDFTNAGFCEITGDRNRIALPTDPFYRPKNFSVSGLEFSWAHAAFCSELVEPAPILSKFILPRNPTPFNTRNIIKQQQQTLRETQSTSSRSIRMERAIKGDTHTSAPVINERVALVTGSSSGIGFQLVREHVHLPSTTRQSEKKSLSKKKTGSQTDRFWLCRHRHMSLVAS